MVLWPWSPWCIECTAWRIKWCASPHLQTPPPPLHDRMGCELVVILVQDIVSEVLAAAAQRQAAAAASAHAAPPTTDGSSTAGATTTRPITRLQLGVPSDSLDLVADMVAAAERTLVAGAALEAAGEDLGGDSGSEGDVAPRRRRQPAGAPIAEGSAPGVADAGQGGGDGAGAAATAAAPVVKVKRSKEEKVEALLHPADTTSAAVKAAAEKLRLAVEENKRRWVAMCMFASCACVYVAPVFEYGAGVAHTAAPCLSSSLGEGGGG
jgi:hypothetical protein